MGVVELLSIYICVGVTLAFMVYRRTHHRAAAAITVPAWPVSVPAMLVHSRCTPSEKHAVERIDAALREGVEATRGTSLGALLSKEHRQRIVGEVVATENRCRKLSQVLAERGLEPDQAARLRELRDRDRRALQELAQLSESLRGQLVLARFAGSTVDGAGAMVGELWARVENLGEAVESNFDAFGGACDARLGGR